eukprot:11204477-Lingulodinium_polyedra.AAC.1
MYRDHWESGNCAARRPHGPNGVRRDNPSQMHSAVARSNCSDGTTHGHTRVAVSSQPIPTVDNQSTSVITRVLRM